MSARFVGTVADAETHKPIAARVYVQDARRQWLFVESTSQAGSAVPNREQWVPMASSVERHTMISAHLFCIQLKRASAPSPSSEAKNILH